MRPLRASIDILIVTATAAALLGGLRLYQSSLAEGAAIERTRAALTRLTAEVGIRSALGGPDLNDFGHPPSVDPEWFEGTTPLNELALGEAPWVEVAIPGEWSRDHPRDPTLAGGRGAMFWYNPKRGIVRARVPAQASDESSRALYATVNGEDWTP